MYTKGRDSVGTDEKVTNWRIRQFLLYFKRHWKTWPKFVQVAGLEKAFLSWWFPKNWHKN